MKSELFDGAVHTEYSDTTLVAISDILIEGGNFLLSATIAIDTPEFESSCYRLSSTIPPYSAV